MMWRSQECHEHCDVAELGVSRTQLQNHDTILQNVSAVLNLVMVDPRTGWVDTDSPSFMYRCGQIPWLTFICRKIVIISNQTPLCDIPKHKTGHNNTRKAGQVSGFEFYCNCASGLSLVSRLI